MLSIDWKRRRISFWLILNGIPSFFKWEPVENPTHDNEEWRQIECMRMRNYQRTVHLPEVRLVEDDWSHIGCAIFLKGFRVFFKENLHITCYFRYLIQQVSLKSAIGNSYLCTPDLPLSCWYTCFSSPRRANTKCKSCNWHDFGRGEWIGVVLLKCCNSTWKKTVRRTWFICSAQQRNLRIDCHWHGE
jgi:hypothetical protein